MYITKVLNNSLLLAKDDNEKEMILMGKGIGHNYKIGSEFNKEDIEKTFVLYDETIKKQDEKIQLYNETIEKMEEKVTNQDEEIIKQWEMLDLQNNQINNLIMLIFTFFPLLIV